MMDVREKLVELLDRFVDDDWYSNEEIADKLIAHGVTVQEWISVEDRLPEADVAVLARCFYHESWRTLVCYTSKRNTGEWYISAVGQWVQVTHWMPLPQPSKGE